MDLNSHNGVQQFNDILSRSKAKRDSCDISFTIYIKLIAGTHTIKKNIRRNYKGKGQRKAFNIEEGSEYSSNSIGTDFDDVVKQKPKPMSAKKLLKRSINSSMTQTLTKPSISVRN